MRKSIKMAALAMAVEAMTIAPLLAQGAPQTISAVDIKAVGSGYRASKIVGSTVVNEKNESVGKIDDLIVGRGDGPGVYAVLSVGGFLGMGNKLVAVRYDQLRADPGHDDYTLLGATKDSLKSLPEFDYAK
jgi:hypothetical protein